ncbi:mechanosensitive ion channel family protein [Paraburkholderia acidisoli]|uniref:Mechanosensitive ion channel n=1 Tax=Paraburkholderia acidisoli TaxID=2571748 RepID=A0A7Z2JIE7_9BURK|nr:mechanosensitive ion channel family protein [Paraburkholderia acidisoli]QGZ65631.1 mechanosensitive ion channel [Paraburkholderia acidisoli]
MSLNAIPLAPLIALVLLFAAAAIVGIVVHFLLFRVVARVARRTTTRIDDALFEFGAFRWLGRLAPVVVVKIGIGLVPNLPASIADTIDKIAFAIIVLCVALTLGATLSAIEHVYRLTHQEQPRVSLKGAMQLVKLILFITAALVIIGDVTGKQIGLLLSGIGAMSAVLMLIFKDTLLGLVAGIQLSSNDMLRIGDWITMPGAGADGTVTDITLNTVKVANFDHTIITIPTWKLITESYQNWRGMSEAGGRRIKRALRIDATSVRFLEAEELARLERLTMLREYLAGKRAVLQQHNLALASAGSAPGNLRRLTNLGTFRGYVARYLETHPLVHREMTCMVRQLPADAEGVPIELYCFTTTTSWAEYETIQADLFDHLIAMLPEFGLRVYQRPTGFDLQSGLAVSREA